MASLVKACLMLYYEILPARRSGRPRYWLRNRADGPRRTTVAQKSVDGSTLQVLLERGDEHRRDEQRAVPVVTRTMPKPTTGELAFVFPGAGNQFLGMGRDFALWRPEVVRRLDRENERLHDQFAGGRFWTPDSLSQIGPRDVALGQVWLGAFMADLLGEFGIRPQAVIGNSLGESAGLFAMRAWSARDEMLRRMETSTLFTEELAGPCRAAARAWNLAPGEPVDWVLGMIDRPADAVRVALAGRQRVYLLMINTPSECVIGGQRRAVQQFIADLGCVFHPIPGVTTVHAEVARSVLTAYRDLHVLPTSAPDGMRFYSGVLGRAYDVTSESAAESIARQAVEPVDFPRVIRQAYDDGVRIFLELGPGASCTRMIGEILAGREHVAAALCVAGGDGPANFLRVLDLLEAHGVSIDRSSQAATTAAPIDRQGAAIVVPVGRKEFRLPRPKVIPRPEQRVEPPREVHRMPPGRKVDDGSLLARTSTLVARLAETEVAKTAAHAAYLRLARQSQDAITRLRTWQAQHSETGLQAPPATAPRQPDVRLLPPRFLDRAKCLEFARGLAEKVLGPDFAHADQFPTRVRLPDQPLMLVDRILSVEGEAGSLGAGRVVTEHDILPGAWYLDAERIPTCIAVEAGQADLFLSGFLGIDARTRGEAMYRLLDAAVTFHRSLPGPGATIRYDIRIDSFFRQGSTHLFRFSFEATVDGEPLLSMSEGCAGFFTAAELALGRGIVQTALDRRPRVGKRPSDWRELVPMAVESYDDRQVDALRHGELAACFGEAFARLPLGEPARLPGGRMRLVDRIVNLDPQGGRYGLGQITGEADIHPDDWFLTCHFVDDQVMPGTLMYECCLHTLRILLWRMGWVCGEGQAVFEPIPGVASRLRCRGQVTAETQKVQYEISLKEIGYTEPDGTPYALADALMYADGRAIVEMQDMSVRLTGMTRNEIESLWSNAENVAFSSAKGR
ncbi:MAG: acyltransferase domain-containing protein, partial [Pirellulales bacterium]